MPYRTFNNWLFDGSRNTPIPEPKDGVDILKYNSPITQTYEISMFLSHGPLNHYLNKYCNNIGLRYMSREELFLFIKKCVLDFKATRRNVAFFKYKRNSQIFQGLREKLPELKTCDVNLLCDIVDKSNDKGAIYQTLGIEKPKKRKVKRTKKVKRGKISLKKFLIEHFSTIKV